MNPYSRAVRRGHQRLLPTQMFGNPRQARGEWIRQRPVERQDARNLVGEHCLALLVQSATLKRVDQLSVQPEI
jgi:hypothetical protein